MARKQKTENPLGKIRSYWLHTRHAEALDMFRRRHGHQSQGGALRAILEVVEETEQAEGVNHATEGKR